LAIDENDDDDEGEGRRKEGIVFLPSPLLAPALRLRADGSRLPLT